MTLSPMSSLRITCLILVFVATVALAEAQETFVNFDFEDQAATAPPHNGALTSLPMTRSGVTLDITRPPAAPFDVLANFSSMPSTWGSRSLDPFALARVIERKLERIYALADRRLSPKLPTRSVTF